MENFFHNTSAFSSARGSPIGKYRRLILSNYARMLDVVIKTDRRLSGHHCLVSFLRNQPNKAGCPVEDNTLRHISLSKEIL